ncbi:hypothetical protein CCYA_CCYA04G1288 [Cyanidiococcus yangmingshanensis]|nr:hypothetical protein CCYA_CCYA04G1288 [Cyanidiococcus yangmingshanensis]
MEAAIKKAIGEQHPRQVKELVLDNRCKQAHPSGLENFDSLEVLSMNSCGLTSLSPGFPMLPALRRLELSDNRLSGAGLELLAAHAPRLEVLNLSGNAIRTLDALKPLRGCLHLRVVDCYGCPVSDLKDYRSFMFREVRGLMVLDGKDENGEDVDDEEEEEGDEPDEEENDDDYEEDEEEIQEEDAVLRQAYGKTRPADLDDDDEEERGEAEDDEGEDEAEYDEDEEEEEDGESDDADSEGDVAGTAGRHYLAGDIDDDEDDDEEGDDYIYDEEDEDEDEEDGGVEHEDGFDDEDNDEEDDEEEYDEDEEEEEEDAEEDAPVSKRHRRT